MAGLDDISRTEFDRLKSKAKKDIDAALTVAAVYMSGTVIVKKNIEKMFRFLKMAADLGDVGAALSVAAHYEGGRGGAVGRDDKKAFAYYMKAAERGNTEGLMMVGDMYLHGRGVKQDAKLAHQYIQAANELNDIAASSRQDDKVKLSQSHAPTLFKKPVQPAQVEPSPSLLKKNSR